jgi:hypothetical protein
LFHQPTAPESPPTPPPLNADVLVMPAEIPFVPAAQRMTLIPSATVAASTQSEPLIGDTVVVGRKKSKKAKKLRQPPPSQEDTMSSRSTAKLTPESGKGDLPGQTPVADPQKAEEEEVAAFDFSSIPNMLDDDDETSTGTIPVAPQKLTKKQKAREKARRPKGSASILAHLDLMSNTHDVVQVQRLPLTGTSLPRRVIGRRLGLAMFRILSSRLLMLPRRKSRNPSCPPVIPTTNGAHI